MVESQAPARRQKREASRRERQRDSVTSSGDSWTKSNARYATDQDGWPSRIKNIKGEEHNLLSRLTSVVLYKQNFLKNREKGDTK